MNDKLCKKCGTTERYRNGKCKYCSIKYGEKYRTENQDKIKKHREENKEYNRKYYAENSEKIKQRVRQWRIDNREKHNEWNRQWTLKNIEKVKESAKQSRKYLYASNPEKYRERRRQYYYTHIDEQRQKHRIWSKNNLANGAKLERIRRARKAKVIHQPYDFEAICRYYGNICLACGRGDIKLTADHVIPISLGGNDIFENIQPLCGFCNSKKNVKIIDYRPLPFCDELEVMK